MTNMKRKLLLATLLVAGALGMRAQTDVTSTYLKNADFSEGPVTSNNVCGYGKDVTGEDVYGFQAVTGWESVVLNGDNTNATFPNSGMGGAVFTYGSSNQLKGNNVSAPAQSPTGSSGNCLAFFGVWGWGGYYYQNVTFPAGKYTITIPTYCVSGTQANKSYIGFITDDNSYTAVTNPKVGEWTTLTVNFTLAAETSGKVALGYKSEGNGSGANPHLFFDAVKIEFTAAVVKDRLASVLSAAKQANATLSNSTLATAITTAQTVYDNADATQEAVNTQTEALSTTMMDVLNALGDATFFIKNPGFEESTAETTNWAAQEATNSADYESTGWKLAKSAGWCSSAVVAYGGEGQVNGVNAPDADNAGKNGNALGISVGWGGTVLYETDAITLPAGYYTLKVNTYNNNHTATQFTSKVGFVPTVGTSLLSSKRTFESAKWETDEISFILNEATEGKIQIGGTAGNSGSGNYAKVFFDNVTLEYKSFLDGAKAEWEEALQAAKDDKADKAYSNVTGEELTALNAEIEKAEPTTVEGYKEATTALNTAANTFKNAAAAYDALIAASATKYTVLMYAADSKKAALDEALAKASDEKATSAADATTKAASIFTLLRAYVESNGLAEGMTGVENKTELIAGANDPENNNAWTFDGNKNDPKSNEPWTDADGTNVHSYYDGGDWGANSWTTTMKQNVTLPAGQYLLTAKGRAAEDVTLTLSVGENSVNLPNSGSTGNVFNNGWNDASVAFETSEDGAVTIQVTATTTANHQWFSVSDFRLVKLPSYVPVQVKKDVQYSTFVIPFKADIPEGVQAFTVDGIQKDGTTLDMTELTGEIPANTPVILYAEAGVESFLYTGEGEAATKPTAGLLTGVYAATVAPVGSYVLQNQNGDNGEGLGFYQVGNAAITVPANKAYLTVPAEAAGAKAFFFPTGDEATAIAGVNVLLNNSYEGIYNAAGVKVNGLQKGLNIVKKGGKSYKIYVK